MKEEKDNRPSRAARFADALKRRYTYLTEGVWNDRRDTWKIRLIKTINLTVRSFLDKNLQSSSMSLTYVTVLAIVPALALMFAIGRGFGLQDFIQKEIYGLLPSQSQAMSAAFQFVDSYLKEASSGVFVGIGIIFLLWTVTSLMGRIEDSFNSIWDVREQRTFMRKITDYTAICLFIPILLIASSGMSIVVSTALDKYLSFLSPVTNILLDLSPFLLVWMAFTLCFTLIPNTHVSFKYGAISAFVCGVAFQILQMLFVNGQIYVSKYNAIYGSFAFLPLFMIWMQLSWLILLIGCMLTYSAQNVFGYNFSNSSTRTSQRYFEKVTAVVFAIIARRFEASLPPLSVNDIALKFDLPVYLVNRSVESLRKCGLLNMVNISGSETAPAPAPASDPSGITLADIIGRYGDSGTSDFIPRFSKNYSDALSEIDKALDISVNDLTSVRITSLPINPHGIKP